MVVDGGSATLITGGVRSGKSAYAEALLAGHEDVTYLATGPVADAVDDAEWADRVTAHQSRREPLGWRTVESRDVASVLRSATGPVLWDCVGTWLTACLDELEAWNRPVGEWRPAWDSRLEELLSAWRQATVVAVTNEVGWGVVSEHRSGRLFADLLGVANQRLAAASDEVILMVMGRPIRF